MRSYNLRPFLSGPVQLACSQGLSVVSHVSVLHSLFWLNKSPLYGVPHHVYPNRHLPCFHFLAIVTKYHIANNSLLVTDNTPPRPRGASQSGAFSSELVDGTDACDICVILTLADACPSAQNCGRRTLSSFCYDLSMQAKKKTSWSGRMKS